MSEKIITNFDEAWKNILNNAILPLINFLENNKVINNNSMNLSKRSEDKELLSGTSVKENSMNLSKRSEDKELLSGTSVKENSMNLSERSEDKELLSGTSVKENSMNLSERSEDKELLSGTSVKENNKLFENDVYIEIYTICFNICTQKSPYDFSNNLYNKYKDTISDYLKINITNILKECHDEILLKEFIHRFENQLIMVKWLKNFMMYLERYYIKYYSLDSLDDIAHKLFKTIIFDKFKHKITTILINNINTYREEKSIDENLIIETLSIYEYMDLSKLDIYKYDFMHYFLNKSREFYCSLSSKWINQYNAQEYIKNVYELIDKETKLVKKYLYLTTQNPLMYILYDELLIKKYNNLILNETFGVMFMLDNEMLDNLLLLYRLYINYTEPLNCIVNVFKEHILLSINMLNKDNKDNKDNKESNNIIEEYILINNKYDKFIEYSFNNNNLFKIIKKDIFISVLNQNNNIELMILFIEKILKYDDIELIEICIENIMKLFIYIIEKDLFVDFYRKSLSKRLLNQKTFNIDFDKYIISKIKIECGIQLTAKIEGMIYDLMLGDQDNKLFQHYLDSNDREIFIDNIDFNVQILTNSHWPNFKLFDIIIPKSIQKLISVFNTFFINKYNHKKITWIYSQGNIILKGLFNKKIYDIQVSILQAIVLLLFNSNNNEHKDYETIFKLTNIPDEILKRVLHSLSCGKIRILKKIEKDGYLNNDKIIKNSDIFQINETFSSAIKKFKIPMPLIDDIKENNSIINEDRTYIIEASIVRIMKARKTLNHNSLISEVLCQLNNFKPEPRLIKMRIESLIEREFLERECNNRDIYNYIA
jgi:cullin 1